MNTQTNAVANTGTEQDQTTALGTLFSLDTFIVNLADQERNRYLRVTMDLELVAPTDAEKLNAAAAPGQRPHFDDPSFQAI